MKTHPWFKDFDWQALQEGRVQANFVPSPDSENFDKNHVNNIEWKDAEAVKENEIHLKHPTAQQLFKGYFFDKNHHTTTKATTTGNTGGGGTEGADTEGQANIGKGNKLNSTLKGMRSIEPGPEGIKSQ